MANFNPAKDIPTEFYNSKTFFTVGGSAAAVWIFCLVLGSIFPSNAITPIQYRIIAISLSEIIAVVMVVRIKKKKLETWLFGIFNGILIFINASGWNVITTNNFFSDKVNVQEVKKERSIGINASAREQIMAGWFNFGRQINWWQDNHEFIEKKTLAVENDSLKQKVRVLEIVAVQAKSNRSRIDSDLVVYNSSVYYNLILELKAKDSLIRQYKLANAAINGGLKSKSTVTMADTLKTDERVKLVNSMREIQKLYETKLQVCSSENAELRSKLILLKRQIEKSSGIDR